MNSDESNSLAERCQRLIESTGQGMLATQSLKHPGYPFASVAPYAVDSNNGQPLFLFSSMATHSKNVRADSRVTLLVAEVLVDSPSQLAAARASIVGDVKPVLPNEIESAKADYLNRHPEAQQWVSFCDFSFFRLEWLEVYFVAGFGSMGWIPVEELKR